MTHEIAALFVPVSEVAEDMDFDTFINPLRLDMWIMLCVSTFVIAILKYLSNYINPSTKYKFIEMLLIIPNSFAANFGVNLSTTQKKDILSHKIILFTSLLCGNIIWMAYQGFLTSELAVVKLLLPFHDMNSLSKTDWRLITPIASSSMTQKITESTEGTDFHKVLKNNIDENSFVPKDRRWIEAKKSRKTAVFDIENNIPEHDRCKVTYLYKVLLKYFIYHLPICSF